MNAATPTVGVVTVTFNSGPYLERFLESVGPSCREPVRTVVADNASADAEAARRVSEAHDATFLQTGANRGYGAAVNAAVREHLADVDWILVVNPDVVLGRGALDALLEVARRTSDAGSVGPVVRETDGSVYPSARRVPSLLTGAGHALLANVWPGNPWTRAYHEDDAAGARSAGWLSGACVLVRASAFRRLGGFDEGYFMYFEDVDLGHRLGRLGLRNLYVPTAEVTHVGAHSTTSSSEAMRRAHHRSAYRFLSRKYGAWYLFPLRVVLRAALAVRARTTRSH